MQRRLMKQFIAWVMLITMVISNMPLQVLAETVNAHQHTAIETESDQHDHDHDEDAVSESDSNSRKEEQAQEEAEHVHEKAETVHVESNSNSVKNDFAQTESDSNCIETSSNCVKVDLEKYLDEMNQILAGYGITEDMDKEAMDALVAEMDPETLKQALADVNAWYDAVNGLEDECAEILRAESTGMNNFRTVLKKYAAKLTAMAETERMKQLRAMVEEILTTYGITAEMTEDEMAEVLFEMDEGTYKAVWDACKAVEEFAAELSEEECGALEADENLETFVRFYSLMVEIQTPMTLAETGTPIEGILVSVSKDGFNGELSSVTVADNSAIIVAKSTSGWFGSVSQASVEVVVKNTCGYSAKVKLDWSIENYASFTLEGASADSSGSITKTLANNGTITFKVKSPNTKNATSTLKLSNFSIELIGQAVTFVYDESLGSISQADGTVASGTTVNVPASGVSMTAVPRENVSFLGWINTENNKILSTEKSFTLLPQDENAMTVRAVFASSESKAWFSVGTEYLYDDLNTAASKASKVVLAYDGTLPAGDYTIPSGVTLLIPFDDANTLYTTEPGLVNTTNKVDYDANKVAHTTPYPYRTLIMQNGAQIEVNGAISLSSKVYAAHSPSENAGAPDGAYGHIKMEKGSDIVVNSSGSLYAYGYITGEGAVLAKNGATVYECFQLNDFRGGSVTSDLDEKHRVFPFSQYYVQNIEVPLTIMYGAIEYAYCAIHIKLFGAMGTAVAFFGSNNAMFNLSGTDSFITKRYDGTTDRLMIEVDGELNVAPMTMEIPNGLTPIKIESKNYELPVNSNITVHVKSGSKITITQNLALLPGSRMIIEQGATCTLDAGTAVYVYDSDDWGGYASSWNEKLVPIKYAPSKTYTRTERDLVDAIIQIDGTVYAQNGFVYTTSGGANIFSTGTGVAHMQKSENSTTQQYVFHTTDVVESDFVTINVTPAQLTHKNGEAVSASEEGTYKYKDNFWHKPGCDGKVETAEIEAATCTLSGKAQDKCACGSIDSGEYETDPLDHDFKQTASEIPAKDATCTTPKYYKVKCEREGCTAVSETVSVAGTKEGDAPLGHSYKERLKSDVLANGATCEAAATYYVKCDRCDNVNRTIEPVSDGVPLPHSYTKGYYDFEALASPATCTEAAKYYAQCDNCTHISDTETVSVGTANGHDFDKTASETLASAATCTSPAKYYVKCDNCGAVSETEMVKVGETIPHTFKEKDSGKEATPATCTEKATHYVQCEYCDAVSEEITVGYGEPKDHEYTKNLLSEKLASPANCTKAAKYYAQCDNCNHVADENDPDGVRVVSSTAEKDKPLGHDTKETVVPPTCTTDGYTVRTCNREGCSLYEIIAGTTVSASHDYKEEVVDPTCTEKGYTKYTCKRTGCGYSYIDLDSYVDAEGHKFTEISTEIASDATCTSPAYFKGKCAKCGEISENKEDYKVDPEGKLLDHVYNSKKSNTQVSEATCEKPAYYKVQCDNCDEVSGSLTVPDGVALGHSYEKKLDSGVVASKATCTANEMHYMKCDRCPHVGEDEETIEIEGTKLGHDFSKMTTETASNATCKENAWYYAACANEGCTAVSDSVKIEKQGSKLDHNYSYNETAPTCTEDGYTTTTCTQCDYFSTQVHKGTALGHSFKKASTEIASSANCTEAAKYYAQCEHCGKVDKTEELISVGEALGHSFTKASTETASNATCTEAAKYYAQCEHCGKVDKTKDLISAGAANGHIFTTKPSKKQKEEATCTEAAKYYKQCDNCTEIDYNDWVYSGGLKDHSYNSVGSLCSAATCTAKAKYYYKCDNCSAEDKTRTMEIGSFAEHTFNSKIPSVETASNATCTEPAYHWVKCDNPDCNVISSTEKAAVGTANGHSYTTKPSVETASDATCTEPAKYYVQCDNCTGIDHTKTVEVGEPRHDMVYTDEVPATCTEPGTASGGYCKRCDYKIGSTTIQALGHEFKEKPSSSQKAPQTCTEAAVYWVQCERCPEISDEKFVSVGEAKGHHYDRNLDSGVLAKAATCTEAATYYVKCDDCSNYTTKKTVPVGSPNDHSFNSKASKNIAKEATCTEQAEYYVQCDNCDEVDGEKTVKAGNLKPHSFTKEKASAETASNATCTKLAEYYVQCDNCTYVDDKQTVEGGSFAPHTFAKLEKSDSKKSDATCTEPAHYWVKCDNPECTEVSDSIDVTYGNTIDHSFNSKPSAETASNATCTTKAKYYVQCDNCDAVSDTVTVEVGPEPLGHQRDYQVIAPTCLKGGYTKHWCKNCSLYWEDDPKDPLNHKYSDTVTEPTCTEQGYTTHTCINTGCKYSYKDTYTNPLNHSFDNKRLSDVLASPSNCTKAATYFVKCDRCEVLSDTLTVEKGEPKGHSFHSKASTETASNATCTESARYYVQCDNCDAFTRDKSVAVGEANGHSYTTKASTRLASASNCTEAAKYYVQCDNCSAYTTDAVVSVGEPNGHSYTTKASTRLASASNCTEAEKYYVQCDRCDAVSDTKTVSVGNPNGHSCTPNVTLPTCTEQGYTTYQCKNCTYNYKADYKAAKGHSFAKKKASTETASNATCTEAAKYYMQCDNCAEIDKSKEPVSVGKPNGHSFTIKASNETASNATCTEAAKYYVQCDNCTEYTTAKTVSVGEANGHKFTTIPSNKLASGATCTEPMKYYVKCDHCKEVSQKDTVSVGAAKGHKFTNKASEKLASASNCTRAAEYYVQCDNCPEVDTVKTVFVGLPNGHSFTTKASAETASNATCTEAAKYYVQCDNCTEYTTAKKVSVGEANGHSYTTKPSSRLASDSNCTKAAEYYVQCDNCPSVSENDIVAVGEPKGHNEVTDWAVSAKCLESGLTEGKHCKTCGAVIKAQETVDPLGHDPVQHAAKRPTWTEVGWNAYETCSRCDYTTKVEIPALGEPTIETYQDFITNLEILEGIADTYVKKVSPGKDPLMLMIKYIRTGVERYNSGSWNIMAGYEDTDFAKYVSKYEAAYNAELDGEEELMAVTGLKNLETFVLPNGDLADIGHMFGTMDITYTNQSSENHADVAGWAGDLADLLSLADQFGVESKTVEDLTAEIKENYFRKFEEEFPEEVIEGTFSPTDVVGDLDGYYIMQELYKGEYENGDLSALISGYMTEDLTMEDRAAYFLKNRLGGVSLRNDVRKKVYQEYIKNSVVATLEGTREYFADNLDDMREACSYVWADYLCKLAGDYVEVGANPYYTVFSSEVSTLAPGITQEILAAETADKKQMNFYIATADLSNETVHVYANYKDNDPGKGWGMARVTDQMAAAQEKYGNPESDLYIPNYNVIAGINASGFNMSTGQPSGLLIMNGIEYSGISADGFFGITKDGKAVIGSKEDYAAYKGNLQEAVGAFGTTLIRNGEVLITADSSYYTNRASRAAVGITKTGKVVFMVLDGRQGEYSCGGSMQEVAQIMLEAGCYNAVNLDGGGSAGYAARPEGESTFRVVSNPSDGVERSVSSSLMMVSTAPSSTEFDHAVINGDYTYLTVGSEAAYEAVAVGATGNVLEMPEGAAWSVSDETIGTITKDGVFTAKANGKTDVQIILNSKVVGEKTVYVVDPDNVYFERDTINVIFGQKTKLPVKAVYEGKAVAINEADVVLTLANADAGVIDGFSYTADETCGLKNTKITAALTKDPQTTSTLTVILYRADEASFDFEHATGGDRQLAWNREVSNAVQEGSDSYRVIDADKDMTASYTFAIDMSRIDIPEQLKDLTYMLPGADLPDASAWTFLLQLAERISDLSVVRPVFRFDPNLEVDYEDLTIANEYFELNGKTFDEETNTLTLSLNWIKQEKSIDAETANPLCILSGLKLTPKDGAAWNTKNQLVLVNTGTISYEIYMRANALYSFAQKEENQQIYGVYPYVNPDNDDDKGGYFGSTYKEFEDRYTLINSDKEGWVIEGDGYAYYENGEKYTGIHKIDGYYYDFGTDGINDGKTKYTGDMTDEKGREYYCKFGEKQSGWVLIAQEGRFYDVRYYNPTTYAKEKLTTKEVKSTCIVDGKCTYTSESGAVKTIEYDDAGGHEYVLQSNGTNVCSVCGQVQIDMKDVKISIGYTQTTYNGSKKTPSATAVAPDGTAMKKRGTTSHSDYYVTYSNNIDVGTAKVVFNATKYGKYVNMTEWRGNFAGTKTAEFKILPDIPTNVKLTKAGEKGVLSWTAAKAPGVTYVIYRLNGGQWTEFAATEATSYELSLGDYSGYRFRIGTRKVVDGVAYESLTFASLGSSSGSSSGGGGGSSSGGGGGGGGSSSGNKKNQTATGTSNGSLPDYVVSGTWTRTEDGKWTFAGSSLALGQSGSAADSAVSSSAVYKKSWAAVYNPYADPEKGQSNFDWFYFDESGYMVTGWLLDGGLWYYLNPTSDGTQGRMYTGWHQIDGKWYYFNPISDGTRGAMQKNMWIGDYYVDENGVWDAAKTK